MSATGARWDAVLAQVRERFYGLMSEAVEGCRELFASSGLDPIPMANAWGAIEIRAKQLETKITETWGREVERAFEREGAPHEVVVRERSKGDALRDEIEVERERTRVRVYADAGRALFARAASELDRPFACVRCGAPLIVPFTFRAVNVPCPHCRTVNGFEPGTRMRLGEGFVHQLSEEASFREWLAMHQADRAARAARPVTIAHLKACEHAQLAYWRSYLSARARFVPDVAAAFDADLRGRMRHFYDRMELERAWIEAGRPREF